MKSKDFMHFNKYDILNEEHFKIKEVKTLSVIWNTGCLLIAVENTTIK